MAELFIRSVLVTGSNRGIGLELVKQFLTKPNPPEWVFAACRSPEALRSQELKSLTAKHSNLVVIQLECTDPKSCHDAAKEVENLLCDTGLNLVINNAGIISKHQLEAENSEEMLQVYHTNVIGPMLVTQAFLPLLKKAALENPQGPLSCGKAAVVNMSSTCGSIGSLLETFFLAVVASYRCSKAALNMLTRCQAELYKNDGILCAALHPGWVQTDMGGKMAPLTVGASVSGLMEVMSSLSEEQNGILLSWEGKTIPW